MRVICPRCGREVGGYVPKQGDGSVLRPRAHRDPESGQPCEGRFYNVELADAIEVDR